jgi:pimeloyl-ACP methyl ester carboxylesterase
MGGLIARQLCERYPDRVRSLAVLYAPRSLQHARGHDLLEERMARPIPQTREAFVDYYADGEALCASKAYAQDIAWLRKLGAEVWDRGWDPSETERQMQAALASLDAMSKMRSVRVPTVIIAGEDDLLIDPASSLELHRMIPDSTLRIFKGMGHELPEPLWNEIIELLTSNARAAGGR